jgi:hypothetical protein
MAGRPLVVSERAVEALDRLALVVERLSVRLGGSVIRAAAIPSAVRCPRCDRKLHGRGHHCEFFYE